MLYNQTMSFGLLLEALVVVDAITGRVLDLVLKIVLVHHLMKECRGGFLNRAVERGGGDVDFVLALVASLPDLRTGDVAVCGRSFLEADDGFGEFALEVMPVELPEHFFKLPGGSAGLNGLFHDFSPLYVKLQNGGTDGIMFLSQCGLVPLRSWQAMGRDACRCGSSWG